MTTTNITGAYLNYRIDEIVTVNFRDRITKIMSLTDHEAYPNYVAEDNIKRCCM